MKIALLTDDMIPEVVAAYDEAFREVPHCYPVGVEAFAKALRVTDCDEGQDSGRRPHPRIPMRSGLTLVAREGGRAVGMIVVAVVGPEEPGGADLGAVRCFWYERGRREAGQALLDAATSYLHQQGVGRIDVYRYEHRLPFYHVEHACLSDRLDHVHALLGVNGYQRLDCEVVLDWRDFEVGARTAPSVPAEVALELTTGRGRRPGIQLRAYQEGRQVGFCVCTSGGDYSDADDAQGWLYTAWLTVAEDVRGRGLGRYLLQRALAEARAIGYRHACLCSLGDNYRALLLYGNLGYRAVDWTYAWRRETGQAGS